MKERIGGRMMLSLVVLREVLAARATEEDPFVTVEVPKIRVLRLDGTGLVVEVWQKEKKESAEGAQRKEWIKVEEVRPKRSGKALPFIPFVFHGPANDLSRPAKPPLDNIIVANLDHYRLDADFKHGLHFTALPTAWVSETQGATAGFLEFKGQGLQTFEREKDRVEKLMAILGSRMLESQKRVSESAEALSLRQAGESSVVANMSALRMEILVNNIEEFRRGTRFGKTEGMLERLQSMVVGRVFGSGADGTLEFFGRLQMEALAKPSVRGKRRTVKWAWKSRACDPLPRAVLVLAAQP